MTGNGNRTTYKNCDMGDGLWHCFTHIIFTSINYMVMIGCEHAYVVDIG